jgi:MtN3 and saliva related transmembrane protein
MEWLGYVAGFCTTIAFLPQVVRTYKLKSAKDVSLGMYLVFCTGVIFWIFYGITKPSMPIILTNLATIILAGTMLVMKIMYDHRR